MEHIKSGIVFSAWSYYLLWFSRACLTHSCQCFIAECANEVYIWLSGPPVRRYEIHKHSSGVNPNIHNKYKIFLPLNLCIKLCKINWEYFSVKSYHTGAHGLLTPVVFTCFAKLHIFSELQGHVQTAFLPNLHYSPFLLPSFHVFLNVWSLVDIKNSKHGCGQLRSPQWPDHQVKWTHLSVQAFKQHHQ